MTPFCNLFMERPSYFIKSSAAWGRTFVKLRLHFATGCYNQLYNWLVVVFTLFYR